VSAVGLFPGGGLLPLGPWQFDIADVAGALAVTDNYSTRQL